MPKLTIITINLNNEKALKKTIESVVKQTKMVFEYIIIDGGSTDGSVEIIKKYEQNITYWVSEPDNGIYNAMNKGIQIANGDYLLFLNSGDWLEDDILSKAFLFDLSAYDIIYGNAFIVDSNGIRTLFQAKDNLTMYDFYNGTICHQATFIKRNLFDKFGSYDERYQIVSDWLYFIQIIIFCDVSVKYIDLAIVNVDGHGIGTKEYAKIERVKAIASILPDKIIKDYEEMIINKDNLEVLLKELSRYKRRFYLIDQLVTSFRKLIRRK